MRRELSKPALVITLILLGLFVWVVAAAAMPDDENKDVDGDGDSEMTAVEAACYMLNDGDTPQFTYDVMIDILKPHSFEYPDTEAAARAAVIEAQAQGCGG